MENPHVNTAKKVEVTYANGSVVEFEKAFAVFVKVDNEKQETTYTAEAMNLSLSELYDIFETIVRVRTDMNLAFESDGLPQ